jgi:chromosome partitioning protein
MRTIAVLNQKGGVGKTTTVANTAAALAAAGSKVVAIDLDPQAHLTIHLGLEPKSIESGSYKVLTQSGSFEGQILLMRPNLWLLPANIDLVGAESELVSVVGRETILREAIHACPESFDYCFIDCAPSLGLLTLNALAAAEEVLIPLQPHFLALQGFGQLLQTIELVNRRINPDLRVKGVLLCMFDTRASLPNEVKADIEHFLGNARGTNSAWSQAVIFPTFIRRNIKLAEAPSYGKTIFEYEPTCNGAEDYKKVAEFIHAQFQLPAKEETPPSDAEQQTESQSDFVEEAQPSQVQSFDIAQDSEPAEPFADANQDQPEPSAPPEPSFDSAQDTGFEGELPSADSEPEPVEPSSQGEPSPEPLAGEQQEQPDTEPVRDEQAPAPPFEIRPISPPKSHEPEEFIPNTDQNSPDTERADF